MLTIPGGQRVSGRIRASGSKNASLPIVATAPFFRKLTLHNVPRIGDIFSLIELLACVGVTSNFTGNTLVLTRDTDKPINTALPVELVKKLRASILAVPAIVAHTWHVSLAYPGGCNLGKRSIKEHLDGLTTLGYTVSTNNDSFVFSGTPKTGTVELSANFSVTATENLMAAAAFRSGLTRIHLAAIEPHVRCCGDFFASLGATVRFLADHTIEIEGGNLRDEGEFTIISDYLESGTFAVLAALSAEDYLDIESARVNDLRAFLLKLGEAGVRFEANEETDTLRVWRCDAPHAVSFQTNIYPGFPTDLQSPFCILLTQAEGISRVHEVLFESRLNFLIEIEKMKWHVALLNPHEALIFGKTPLRWTTVSSWDLRSGVAMVLAALVAQGETHITNVDYIKRGYEDIIEKLASIGVKSEYSDNTWI